MMMSLFPIFIAISLPKQVIVQTRRYTTARGPIPKLRSPESARGFFGKNRRNSKILHFGTALYSSDYGFAYPFVNG
jgi:hypothetical protein